MLKFCVADKCYKNRALTYGGNRVGFKVFGSVKSPVIEYIEKVMSEDAGFQVRNVISRLHKKGF
jgi:hypothetical protein